MKWSEWNGGKKEQILILFLFGVLLLVIAVPTKETKKETLTAVSSSETSPDVSSDNPAKDWSEYLEQKLQRALSQVAGAGKTEVLLTVHSGGRALIEKDEALQEENKGEGSDNTGSTIQKSETTVYQKDSSGNEIPFVTEKILPEICGVLILAQGGDNGKIQAEITEAAMALFDLEAHKIKVMKLE